MVEEADFVLVYTAGKGETAEKSLRLAQQKKKLFI